MTTLESPDDAEILDLDAQEILEWRDLQAAQIISMTHVWDNPEDECWNELTLDESGNL
jgi:hypothetical protein